MYCVSTSDKAEAEGTQMVLEHDIKNVLKAGGYKQPQLIRQEQTVTFLNFGGVVPHS